MSKLAWGAYGERVFETGTDRGVLYLPEQSGVPWSGLKAISESPDGGEPKPYYFDGFKYLNVASSEDFTATLTAFASPKAFDDCDGTIEFKNGLFATQQPRKPFGLSYRTLLGNDSQSVDYGYKIHIIYNALASPTPRNNQTTADTISPLEFSWGITTTPPKMSGLKPTAHFIIDSRYTPSDLMAAAEDILYGSANTESYLPTPTELMELFSNYIPSIPQSPYGEYPYGENYYGA